MEIIDGIVCISHDELTGCIITPANLNNLVRRGHVRQLQKGGNGRVALYDADSFPLKWRTEIYRRFPDPREQAESREFLASVTHDGAAFDFFQSYRLGNGSHLPESKVLEYANNAAIMNAFRQRWEAHVSKRQRSGKRTLLTKGFWTNAAAILPYLSDRFPHSLPGNPRRLQMKFAEYANTGYECFISGKFQNGNAGKVVDMFQQSYISALLSHPNNLPDTKIADLYNAMGEYHGWEPITAKAVGTWRRKLGAKISAGRLGVSNFRNHLTMQVKRSRPTTPMLMCRLTAGLWSCCIRPPGPTKRGTA